VGGYAYAAFHHPYFLWRTALALWLRRARRRAARRGMRPASF